MDSGPHDGDAALPGWWRAATRRRWTVLAVWAAVLAAMAGYARYATPVYRASALIQIEKVSDIVAERASSQYPDEDYLATQAKLIVSESALQRAHSELRLESKGFPSLASLRAAVSVLAVPRTRLCYVSAESPDPLLAQVIAAALAQNYVDQNLNNQLFMSKKVLAALQTRAKDAYGQSVFESLPAVVKNPLIQDLKTQIYRAEAELAELKVRFKPDHPAALAMDSRLALMRQARDREVENIVRSIKTELSGQLRPNNVRIVDPARRPEQPVRPRKALALILGLLGGLGLGLLAATGLETLDETIRTHQDVERGLGLRVLGQIPQLRPPSGEAFRTLRAMLGPAKPGDDPFLMVTSAAAREGKSFVATNLAVALATLGQPVLVIDGDLRRPSQHLSLGSRGDKGLGEFLSGRVRDPGELIQSTEFPHLQLVGCGGAAPANPAELLSAERLAELVAWARGRYARVIVDCPPVFPVGDVLLWGRHVRAALFVSRSGRTPLPLSRRACARLRESGIDLLGGVINGARPV